MDCSHKSPKGNWSQHAKTHNNFLSQNKFLDVNFLFSLSTQKPQIEATGSRSVFCQVQDHRMHNQQLDKVLSRLQLSSRSYTKPGKTLPLTRNINAFTSQSSRQTTQQLQSDLKSTAAGRDQNIKIFSKGDALTGNANKSLDSCFLPQNFEVKEARQVVVEQNSSNTSVKATFQRTTMTDKSAYTNARNGAEASFSEDNDDDILENNDVDQIVMDHYQSTPQPSMSKLPPITPHANKDNFTVEAPNLPPDLCLICSHGYKLGLCPDASNHLQEMKDTLIAISNDLIDNVDEMTSEKVETLRQERKQLKEQIKQLEDYIHETSVNEERKMSHFSASTATPMTFQYDNPTFSAYKLGPTRLDSQFQANNAQYGSDR